MKPSFIFLILSILSTSVLADICDPQTTEPASSPNGRFYLDAYFVQADGWHYRLDDRHQKVSVSGLITNCEWHAHLEFLVPDSGETFAVLDTYAGQRIKDRIMIFKRNGALLRSYGIDNFLSQDEIMHIQGSVSHLFWVKRVSGKRHNAQLELIVRPAKRFLISMSTGEILPYSDKIIRAVLTLAVFAAILITGYLLYQRNARRKARGPGEGSTYDENGRTTYLTAFDRPSPPRVLIGKAVITNVRQASREANFFLRSDWMVLRWSCED